MNHRSKCSSRGSRERKGVVVLAGLAVLATLMACAVAPFTAGAEGCPNAQLRQEANSTQLPDCRAYEMVSPADKNGGSVAFEGYNGGASAVSAEGNRVLYESFYGFAEAPGVFENSYWAERGTSGWHTTPASPAPSEQRATYTGASTQAEDASEDASTLVFSTADSFDPLDQDGAPQQAGAIDVYTRTIGAPMDWASRPNTETVDTAPDEALYRGRSADGSHILFETEEHLVAPESGPTQLEGSELYDRTDGHTYLVGLTSEGALVGQCGATAGAARSSGERFVSADGSEVTFSSSPCGEPNQLYLRIDNRRTVEVSRSHLPSPAEAEGVQPVSISRDGSRVFFTASNRLSPEAPSEGGLYEYDVETDDLHLILPTAEFSGLIGLSEDGRYLYLRSAAQLTSDAPPEGGVYALADGTVEYVGKQAGEAVVSPDGRVLAFTSTERLSEYDNAGYAEVYSFDADTDKLTCVSCRPDGTPPTGAASLGGGGGLVVNGRPISSDDRRIFFQSADRIVPGDANSSEDVYEYEDGSPHLISSGRGDEVALFVGASADGKDVMFSTTESLVGQDTDGGATDIYDARVEGGFPAPSEATGDSCSGDSCQAQATSPPIVTAPGSANSESSASITPPLAKKPAVTPKAKPLSRAQKLTKALKACRARQDKRKRTGCEAQARKTYGASHKTKAKTSNRRGA